MKKRTAAPLALGLLGLARPHAASARRFGASAGGFCPPRRWLDKLTSQALLTQTRAVIFSLSSLGIHFNSSSVKSTMSSRRANLERASARNDIEAPSDPRFKSFDVRNAASDDEGYTNHRLYDTDDADDPPHISPTIDSDMKARSSGRRVVVTTRGSAAGKDATSAIKTKKKAATAVTRSRGASLSLRTLRRRNTRRYETPRSRKTMVNDNDDDESDYEDDDEDDDIPKDSFEAFWNKSIKDFRNWYNVLVNEDGAIRDSLTLEERIGTNLSRI